MKMLFWILGIFFFALIIFIAWASYPWSISENKIQGEVKHIDPEVMVNNEENPSVIKILTWNLSYLYGEGSEGGSYQHKDKNYYQEKLNQLAAEIQEWQPDIICLQEVDFNSFRSGGINQVEFLGLKAGYPYIAEAVSWQANYIPFPYWPVSNHFKAVESGGAILSKYPILSHEYLLLAKPQSHPWWYNLFYLHRYFQKVTLEVGSKKFNLINLHLEAFDKNNRQEQIKMLIKKIEKEKIDLVAGDFNMVPKNATKRSKFANNDDYENDLSAELMSQSALLEVIPDEIYDKNEAFYFTFPATHPDRRLDYIFYRKDLKMMKAEVLSSALSDHLPIRATFQIDSPKFNPYSL
ncbi:MAG: endonuclease/exonuclease/phosphatase family protein [Bacteriovoracaceae bacterium]